MATAPIEHDTVHARFDAIAARYSRNFAVAGKNKQLRYREIAELSHRYAAAIAAHVDRPGPVIIQSREREELFALFLGILRTGRPYLVVSPDDPPARLQALVERSGAALIVTDQMNAGIDVTQIDWDTLHSSRSSPLPVDVFDGRIRADSPACLTQTSGSTGEPRGVSLSHRTLLHHNDNYRAMVGITPADRLSLLASPRFTAANSAIYGALLGGACLCPFALKQRGFADLLRWLSTERITVLHITPSLFRALAKQLKPAALPHLRIIKLGGEPAYRSDALLFRDKFSARCTLINGLGISEVGGNICRFVLNTRHIPDDETLPVGTPLPGLEVHVIRNDGTPAPANVEGEIVVRSRHLADTDWRTIPHETGSSLQEIRTGDRGMFRSNGDLVHLGRQDRVVKLRGYRVDLHVVEAAVLGLPSVKNAAAFCTADTEHDQVLHAYVVPVEPGSVRADDVRSALSAALPDYMIPQRIHVVAELPVTGSGKIDRQSLFQQMGATNGTDLVPPRTELERRLIGIWTTVLRRDRIGVYDNFFELGGDSLKALELLLQLSECLGRKMPVTLLINHPTIAQMAEALSAGLVRSRVAPLFRRLHVSLLPLRRGGKRPPFVFIPGGYTSESELLVCAGLMPHLQPDRPIFGVHLGLLARRVLPPLSIPGLARRIVKLLRRNGLEEPIIVGECHACALAYETAHQLGRGRGTARLILLDPWHADGRRGNVPQSHAAMRRYFRLLHDYHPASYSGDVALVTCEGQPAPSSVIEYWQRKVSGTFHVHRTPGNHSTYIRGEKHHLAELLNSICR